MTTPDAGAVTILFVDDEPAVLRAISRVVGTQTRFRVLTATSAKEALAVLGTSAVDVLVSDIDMPEMSGLELVRAARRDFPSTLRILLTGAGTMDRAVNAINEGEVVRFFTKPFEPDMLVHALEELVDRVQRLRREREAEAHRERRDQFFAWIEERYPGTLALARNDNAAVVIDVARLRAHFEGASPEVRALLSVIE
ncbi:MAG: response regulator [Polyangiaceae bacterium]